MFIHLTSLLKQVKMIKEKLRGTGVAIITPFKNNKVDFAALEKLVEFIITNGVQYIVSLGTTGETPVLTMQEKKEIIQTTVSAIDGRCPLVIGVGGNNTKAVIEEINSLTVNACDAILSAGPYYNKPSQEGIFQHYQQIANNSAKPIIIYNVPSRTGRNISSSTILRLANGVPNICGIKEAGGDFQQCMDILKDAPDDFAVVSGDDALALPQIACGMNGIISVAANAFPSQFSKMIQYCLDSDFESAKKINDYLIPAYELMFSENNPAGIKAFLSEMKLIENDLRLPLVPLSEGLTVKVSSFLKNG